MIGIGRSVCAAVALLGGAARLGMAQTAESAKLPGAQAERDTAPRISYAKLQQLPAGQRALWNAYLNRSASRHADDRAAVDAELQRAGLAKWVAAPYAKGLAPDSAWRGTYFGSSAALTLAKRYITWQTPAGGWSKHVEMAARDRKPGESYFSENDQWQYIGTFDNDATTTQLFLLGHVAAATRDADVRTAFAKGVRYVLDAQYPNGCFPQVYPLQGGYHDNATFNDDGAAHALRFLRDIAQGRYATVAAPEQREAQAAFQQGLDCILDAQVKVQGVLTVWGQQHDPVTLVPTSARSYELPSLTGRESVALVELLMDVSVPTPRMVTSVHAAVDWFRANAIRGVRYEDFVMTPSPDGGPLWARMAEIGTNRPMYFNRDGVTHYTWDALTDRRTGYVWLTDAPLRVLSRYDAWAAQHPRGAK